MCDTYVVLPEATLDGSILFGKNSDRDPNEPHYVEIVPAKDHLADTMLDCTYVSIPQVSHTNRIIICRPVWIWGAEMGANEHGVVIGNEAVFSKIPAGKESGLIGMDYLRLGLERAANAYDALLVITDLLEKYGQSGNCGFSHPFYYHNSFLICDQKEAWKLETAGRQWAAKKIERFGSISNGLTIGYEWDLCSSGMVSFALDKKIYKKNLRFNFADVYSDWLYTRFSNSLVRRNCTSNQIASLAGKFDLKAAFDILRSHHGTEDKFSPGSAYMGSDVCMHAGFGPIRSSQTTGSMVTKNLEGNMEIWVTGSSAACISLFKPCRMQQNQLFQFVPGREYEPDSYWWRHEKFHRKMLHSSRESLTRFQEARDAIQADLLKVSSNVFGLQAQVDLWEESKARSLNLLNDWEDQQKDVKPPRKISLHSLAWDKNNREAKIDL